MAGNVLDLITRLTGGREVVAELERLNAATRQTAEATRRTGEAANDAVRGWTGLERAVDRVVGRYVRSLATIAGIEEALRRTIGAAAAAEVATQRLATTLTAIGVNAAAVSKEANGAIESLKRFSGFGDTELKGSLTRLVQITGDYRNSLGLLALASNVARGSGDSLATATELVGRVAAGQTEILRRQGFAIRENAKASEGLAALERVFAGGVASVTGATRAWDEFKNTLSDFAETLSGVVLPVVSTVLNFVTSRLRGAIELIGIIGEALSTFSIPEDILGRVQRAIQGITEALPGLDTAEIDAANAQKKFAAAVTGAAEASEKSLRAFRIEIEAFATPVSTTDDRIAILTNAIGALRTQLKTLAAAFPTTEAAAMSDEVRALVADIRFFEAGVRLLQAPLDQITVRMTRFREASRGPREAGATETSTFDAILSDDRLQKLAARLEKFTGLTEDTFLTLGKISTSLWQTFEAGAADAFAQALVFGKNFAESLKALFKQLLADLVALIVRSGLQRAIASLLNVGTPGQTGGAFGTLTSAVAAIPVIAGITQFVQQQSGASFGTSLASVGLAFPTAGLSLVVPFLGGKKRRRAKRRERERGSFAAELEAIGADPALVEQFEAAFGAFGEGSGRAISGELVGIAGAAGLRGEQATRALAFRANLGQVLPPALAQAQGVIGGLSGLAPIARDVERILTNTGESILKEWTKVEDFFMRLGTALAAVGETLGGGVVGAVREAISQFLGEGASIFENLRAGIRAAIEGAIIEAVVQGTLIQGALGGLLQQLTEALVTGVGDPQVIIRQIAAAIPAVAAQLETVLAPLRQVLNSVFPTGGSRGGLGVVPAFQHGGLVTRPTLGLLGEAGPELVLPLRGGGRGPLVIDLTVDLDGRPLVRRVLDLLPSEGRLRAAVAR